MKKNLTIKLLGKPEVYLGKRNLTEFGAMKTRALLYYLVTTHTVHARAELAELLWPNSTRARARQYLRSTLMELRKHFADYLTITPQTVAFTSAFAKADDGWIDLYHFATFLAETGDADSPQVDSLRAAVDLYKGEFLSGFHVPHSAEFSQWQAEEGARLHNEVVSALWHLIENRPPEMHVDQIYQDLDRLLALEPWHEAAHRHKMRQLAADGERQAALRQYELCRTALLGELGIAPDEDTEALVARIRAGESVEPLVPIKHHPHINHQPNAENLALTLPSAAARTTEAQYRPPVPTLPLLGHDALLAVCNSQLQNPTQRLFTLTGAGGIGKSHIALVLAQQLKDSYPHGVCFVDLLDAESWAEEQEQMLQALSVAVANALQLPFVVGDSLVKKIEHYVETRQMLLILDGFEHLLPVADFLTRLLQYAPGLTMLVTSQARLQLAEETVIRVDPLPVPPKEERLNWRDYATLYAPPPENAKTTEGTAGDMSPPSKPYACIQLFMEHARRRSIKGVLSAADLPLVAQICRMVGGLPLAIGMAANWTEHLSCAEIASGLEADLSLLTISMRNVPDHHRSVDALLGYSLRLISPEQEEHLLSLTFFAGSFSLHAAQTITSLTLPMLQTFLDKSMLIHTETGRYALHPLIKRFLHQRWLQRRPENHDLHPHCPLEQKADLLWLCYCRYYLTMVTEQSPGLNRTDASKTLTLLSNELENIQLAWQKALQKGYVDLIHGAFEGAIRFYNRRGLYAEALRCCQSVEAFVHAADATEEASLLQQLRGNVYVTQAEISCKFSAYPEAILLAKQALEVAQKHTLPVIEIRGHLVLSNAGRNTGSVAAAWGHQQRALQAAQTNGQANFVGDCQMEGAGIASMQQQLSLVEQLGQAALVNYRLDNDLPGEATALSLLGDNLFNGSWHEEAHTYLRQTLRLNRQLEDRHSEADTLNALANVLFSQIGPVEAIKTFQDAVTIFNELEVIHDLRYPYSHLGLTYLCLGQYDLARANLAQALHWSEQSKDNVISASVLGHLSTLARWQGEEFSALQFSERALELSTEHIPHVRMYVLTCQGLALLRMGRLDEAEVALQKAHSYAQTGEISQIDLSTRAAQVEIAFCRQDLPHALSQVAQLFPELQQQILHTIPSKPFYPHWICYQVLKAAHDPRADYFLAETHAQLQNWAARIHDDELRRSFLEIVNVNRQIVAEYQGASRNVVRANLHPTVSHPNVPAQADALTP